MRMDQFLRILSLLFNKSSIYGTHNLHFVAHTLSSCNSPTVEAFLIASRRGILWHIHLISIYLISHCPPEHAAPAKLSALTNVSVSSKALLQSISLYSRFKSNHSLKERTCFKQWHILR